MNVYYNDFEPFACESIRRNIARGRLGAGHVDGRSIVEVQPADLDGYAICHFFAGIAGFELARLMAGWPDDRQLWTGGFPCQDISCAGKGEGLDGSRSGLWFEFLRLIRSCRPARLLVENVPALRTRGADEVLDGLEGAGYAARPIVVGAHAVGAPHRRQRVWIVCEHVGISEQQRAGAGREPDRGPGRQSANTPEPAALRQAHGAAGAGRADAAGGDAMAQPMRGRLEGRAVPPRSWDEGDGATGAAGPGSRNLADADCARRAGTGAGSGDCERTDSDAQRGFGVDQSADGGAAGLADSQCDGRREHQQGRESQRGTAAGWAGETRWPARPGEPQHEWEEPRLVYAAGKSRGSGNTVARRRSQGRTALVGSGACGVAAARATQQPLGSNSHGLPRRLVDLVRRHSDFDDAQAAAWLIRNKVRIANAWRRHALKAVGNAIVPQVAAGILRAWQAVSP